MNKLLILLFISTASFAQVNISTSVVNKEVFYGFNAFYSQKEGIQEINYSAGYSTSVDSDFINLGISGKHGNKSYFGAGFSGTIYRFKNDFNQTIISFDPVIGYHFKHFNLETGIRLRLQNFGEATQVKHVPFISIGLR